MAIKRANKTVCVTLTPYHLRKLNLIKSRTNLSITSIIQRLIEGHDVFDTEDKL